MRILFAIAVLAGCGVGAEPIEIQDGILIAVEERQQPKLEVNCTLQDDKKTCGCAMSECSQLAISEAVKQCERLRRLATIVIE